MTVQELPTALRNLSIPVTARLRPNKTNGLYVIFPNGVIVSMVWRPGSYSDNHDMWVDLDDPQAILRPLDSRTVEVGIFDTTGRWLTQEYPGAGPDPVLPYQTADDVQAILAWAERYRYGEAKSETPLRRRRRRDPAARRAAHAAPARRSLRARAERT